MFRLVYQFFKNYSYETFDVNATLKTQEVIAIYFAKALTGNTINHHIGKYKKAVVSEFIAFVNYRKDVKKQKQTANK